MIYVICIVGICRKWRLTYMLCYALMLIKSRKELYLKEIIKMILGSSFMIMNLPSLVFLTYYLPKEGKMLSKEGG